eukprot:gene9464-6646_t
MFLFESSSFLAPSLLLFFPPICCSFTNWLFLYVLSTPTEIIPYLKSAGSPLLPRGLFLYVWWDYTFSLGDGRIHNNLRTQCTTMRMEKSNHTNPNHNLLSKYLRFMQIHERSTVSCTIQRGMSFIEALRKCLTREVCEEIEINGFAVLDSPLPESLVKDITAQVKQCFHTVPSGKTPNAVQFLTAEGPVQLTKPHIFECDLHQTEIRRQLPFFDRLFESELSEVAELLRDRVSPLEDLVPFDTAEAAAAALTLKLQMNEGGAFPWHYDNPGRPNKRRLTMAVYLTENWSPAVGGELQLMPFLEPPVTVPPKSNTVALFRSDLILHRTLPLHTAGGHVRYCFTVWFDGMRTNSDDDLYLRSSHLREDQVLLLKRSPLQRTLSRPVYEEEYRQAIEDCFGRGTPSCKVALAEHEAHVRQLVGVPAVKSFVDLLVSHIRINNNNNNKSDEYNSLSSPTALSLVPFYLCRSFVPINNSQSLTLCSQQKSSRRRMLFPNPLNTSPSNLHTARDMKFHFDSPDTYRDYTNSPTTPEMADPPRTRRISGFSISATTLEEVFIQIANKELEEREQSAVERPVQPDPPILFNEGPMYYHMHAAHMNRWTNKIAFSERDNPVYIILFFFTCPPLLSDSHESCLWAPYTTIRMQHPSMVRRTLFLNLCFYLYLCNGFLVALRTDTAVEWMPGSSNVFSLSLVLIIIIIITIILVIMSGAPKMDVIEATAEALPLEKLNATNRELTAQLSHFEQLVYERRRDMDDQRKRLQFMREHLGNVRAEIVNTQGLTESKRKEVESLDNMRRLIERECGRLKQKHRHLKQSEEQIQDQITSLENRVFQGNLRMEEFKRAMDFNQEELDQWDEARRQKEEDELAIAQYSKQDEARIKELTLGVQKLEAMVKEQRRRLEEEMMASENAQIELDRCATEYRKLHDERSGLLDEWEQVVKSMADRDNAIRIAADQYSEGIEWLMKRQGVKKTLSEEYEGLKEESSMLNYRIKDLEKKAQQLRDAIPTLRAQVQEMDDEVDVMREQVSRAIRDKKDLKMKLLNMDNEMEHKRREFGNIQKRREAASNRLQEEMEAAHDLQKQSDLIAQLLRDAQKMAKNLEKDVEQLSTVQFNANQELQGARNAQNDLLSHISGCQSEDKNMKAKISQLDGESFQQQVVLYNIEFNVQQMIKKVSRAKGDRTDRERKELQSKIDLLQKTLDELEQQHRVLDTQVKRVREDLRRSKVEIEKLEASKKAAEDRVLAINLECGHCNQDSKRLERDKEDSLVQVDTMQLQLNRLKQRLRQRSDELVDLEEQKQSLAADIVEREAEIAVHHNLLSVEAKMAEDERRRLVNELLERQKTLNAIRNRHEVLVGKMDPSLVHLSQAQLVVEAAKEREDLHSKKMIAILRASNSDFKHKFDPVSENDVEMKARKALMEKYRELKVLMSRRALETNDYDATLQMKRGELNQLAMKKNATREAAVRYDQAISKAKRAVDETVSEDVSLQENKERLQLTVHRLLECSRGAGEEVYEAVKKMVVEANLPLEPEM